MPPKGISGVKNGISIPEKGIGRTAHANVADLQAGLGVTWFVMTDNVAQGKGFGGAVEVDADAKDEEFVSVSGFVGVFRFGKHNGSILANSDRLVKRKMQPPMDADGRGFDGSNFAYPWKSRGGALGFPEKYHLTHALCVCIINTHCGG